VPFSNVFGRFNNNEKSSSPYLSKKCAFKAILNSNDNMLQHEVEKKGKKFKNWIASVGELNCALFHFSSKN